ncbi:MAG: hypothetical protein ACK53Y_28325 [bacterium]
MALFSTKLSRTPVRVIPLAFGLTCYDTVTDRSTTLLYVYKNFM